MKDRDREIQLQCVVDEGILLNRRDIVRVLRDLGLVQYLDLHDGIARSTGEGYITSVVANHNTSTIIANKRIYLNAHNFEYLRLGRDNGQAYFDLVDRDRTIRLIPIESPAVERPPAIQDEAFAAGRVASLFGDSLTEVYFDEEDDDEE